MTAVTLVSSLYFIGCAVSFVRGDRFTDEDMLHDVLFKDYNRHVRPPSPLNSTEGTTVYLTLLLFAIKDFDDKLGHLSISCMFESYWTDSRLQWNATSYGDADNLHIHRSLIWTPTLTLMNPVYELLPLGHNVDGLATIFRNGNVRYRLGSILHSVCQADVTYFPFDTQHCCLEMIPYFYTIKELNYIVKAYQSAELEFFMDNGMWKLEQFVANTSRGVRGIVGELKIYVSFTRNPVYYVINIILPINLLCMLNIFVFFLPADSGERVGYSVTMFLSMAVFLTIVADRLPESSKPSILGFLFFVKFCLSGFIMICVILSLRCFHSTNKIPTWVAWVVRCCHYRSSKARKIDVENVLRVENEGGIHEPNKTKYLDNCEGIRHREHSELGWHDICKCFDFACTVLFITFFVVVLSTYLAVYAKRW